MVRTHEGDWQGFDVEITCKHLISPPTEVYICRKVLGSTMVRFEEALPPILPCIQGPITFVATAALD